MFKTLSQFWKRIQGSLFPKLEEELGPLTEKQLQLVAILEVVRIEQFLPRFIGCVGRPQKDRAALARAFVAKVAYNMTTTRALIERVESDASTRRICGWERRSEVPDESTFSRAFSEFAESELPKLVHDALISKVYENRIIDMCLETQRLSKRVRRLWSRRKRKKNQKNEGAPKREKNAPRSLSDWISN